MDRVTVYDGALPLATDILNTNKFAMVAQAFQNAGVLGTATVVAGLETTPTLPTATLSVVVGAGTIYEMDPTDQNAYGDLGTDTNNIMKQAILDAPVTLPITPPTTSGFSQVFLVQAILNDVDGGAQVLNYYNSTNPDDPFSGPANSGDSNFTIRACNCVIALKAGVAAATGSQVAPNPDAGFTGLYAITVTNGQTQIISSNIARLTSAPYFPTLPSVPGHVLKGDWVWAEDTGAANAYAVTINSFAQLPTAYQAGFGVKFKASNANSGTSGSTVNVNGLGVAAIKRAGGAALVEGDILSGQVVSLVFDGVSFQMDNYTGVTAGSTSNNFTSVSIPYVPDTGTQNALIGNYSPAIVLAQQVAGLIISIKIANNITGATTINVNGLGLKNVDLGYQLAPPGSNMFSASEVLLLIYDGIEYQIISASGGTGTQGPAGAAGAQGLPGTVSTTPGAVGQFAFLILSNSGGAIALSGSRVFTPGQNIGFGAMLPLDWLAPPGPNTNYTAGTWQFVSGNGSWAISGSGGFFNMYLVQRIA